MLRVMMSLLGASDEMFLEALLTVSPKARHAKRDGDFGNYERRASMGSPVFLAPGLGRDS